MSEVMISNTLEVSEALKSMGYRAKICVENAVFSQIISASGGRPFSLFCFVAEEDKGQITPMTSITSINFSVSWLNLSQYNETEIDFFCDWINSNLPSCRICLSDAGSGLSLEFEYGLDNLEGMTQEAFGVQVMQFIDYLEYAQYCLTICPSFSTPETIKRHDKAVELKHGLEKNLNEAVDLYQQNAHIGFAGSQNNLGDLYEKGEGVPQDNFLALYWYTRSSERGEPTSYLSLASMFLEYGTSKDALILSAKYALLAIERLPEGRNMASALLIRDTLKDTLDPLFYEQAEKLASEYKPLYKEKWTMSDAPGPEFNETLGSTSLH